MPSLLSSHAVSEQLHCSIGKKKKEEFLVTLTSLAAVDSTYVSCASTTGLENRRKQMPHCHHENYMLNKSLKRKVDTVLFAGLVIIVVLSE